MSMMYKVRRVGDVSILDLSGRVSLGEALAFGPGSAIVLHEVVRDQVKNGHQKILLNLDEVSYVDSSGLGELISCHTTVVNQGGDLRISGARPQLNDLLRMTKLNAVLEVHPDEETALQAFSQGRQKGTSAA
jgi:anti-sigma B factor antagonist